MRLLIGTLYSGENEFEESCQAIKKQSYDNYYHLVIKNLTKIEAHNKLYSYFMDNSNEFDLLIKIDADMVIIDHDFFSKIVTIFQKNKKLDRVIIPLLDFFVSQKIMGINIYRNTVKWVINSESVFTDRKEKYSNKNNKEIYHSLSDSVIHCKNPSLHQAFHFGYHRGFKGVQPGIVKAKKYGVYWKDLKKVLTNYKENKDERVLFALLGFYTATFGFNHTADMLSNNSTQFTELLNKYKNMSIEQKRNKIRNLKLLFWFIKPSYVILWFMHRIYSMFSINTTDCSE